jgi:serine/threonine-protein kinase
MLAGSAHDRFWDSGLGGTAAMIDGYVFPNSWYKGLVARGEGNIDTALHAFEEAERVVEIDLAQWPDDAKTIMMLAFIHAALGRKEDALREGHRAVGLLPISKDTYDGPILATNLAAIYAQVGKRDLALEQLARLVEVPNGPTPGTLRIEPEWDVLRGDPRFDKIVASLAPK